MRKQSQSLTEVPDFPSFILFDGKIQKIEGFVTPVFYYESSSNSDVPLFINNFAGLLLTYIQLSKKFSESEPCSYIRTEKHEIAMLELSNDVWFAFCRKHNKEHNRHILQSTLLTCREVYNLFFDPPKRDSNENITKLSILQLKCGFQMIVSSINWGKRAFVHLFDSFFQFHLPDIIQVKFSPLISDVISQQSIIAHTLIMHSKDVLYNNFPIDVARTLAICFSLKLSYLFPKMLEKEEKKLYWIIGPSQQRGNIEIYAPPININNKQYPIVALKMKKFKFILAIKPDVVPTPSILMSIPHLIRHLVKFFSKITVENRPGKWSEPYVVVENIPRIHMISIKHANLSDLTILDAEAAIFKSHLFADNYGNYFQNVVVVYPETKEYIVYGDMTDI